MRHAIDPLVDPVFKAIFAEANNKNLLVHFLNAVLDLETPVATVSIQNTHNQQQRLKDKLTILDVRATDQNERSFQIEVQIDMHPALSGRMLFTWAELFTRQLKQGQDYPKLRPAIAIWIMGGNFFKESSDFHHYLTMSDIKTGVSMEKTSGIHVLELPKWVGGVQSELDRWVRFFREGESLDGDNLPEFMRTPEMKQAMSTVMQFSEDEEAYQQYRHERDTRRYANTILNARKEAFEERDNALGKLDDALGKLDDALGERDNALAHAQQAEQNLQNFQQEAQAELGQLRQLLREKDLSPK